MSVFVGSLARYQIASAMFKLKLEFHISPLAVLRVTAQIKCTIWVSVIIGDRHVQINKVNFSSAPRCTSTMECGWIFWRNFAKLILIRVYTKTLTARMFSNRWVIISCCNLAALPNLCRDEFYIDRDEIFSSNNNHLPTHWNISGLMPHYIYTNMMTSPVWYIEVNRTLRFKARLSNRLHIVYIRRAHQGWIYRQSVTAAHCPYNLWVQSVFILGGKIQRNDVHVGVFIGKSIFCYPTPRPKFIFAELGTWYLWWWCRALPYFISNNT